MASVLWEDFIEGETPDGMPEVVPVRMLDDGTAEEFNGSPEWGGTNEWVPLQEHRAAAFEAVLEAMRRREARG